MVVTTSTAEEEYSSLQPFLTTGPDGNRVILFGECLPITIKKLLLLMYLCT